MPSPRVTQEMVGTAIEAALISTGYREEWRVCVDGVGSIRAKDKADAEATKKQLESHAPRIEARLVGPWTHIEEGDGDE